MKKIVLVIISMILFSCSSESDEITQPPCVNSTNISVTNISLSQATINWLGSTSNQTSYIIEYGEEGFILGTGTSIETTDLSYTVNNLTSFKTFEVYVRALCATDWVGPTAFTTQCNFDTGVYNGDVTLATQQEVDDFGAQCYTSVTGKLDIGNNSYNNIVDLSPLINIYSVGSMHVVGTELTSLYGVNLDINSVINELKISFNHNLLSLIDISIPSEIRDLRIQSNDTLESLEGLNQLNTITFYFLLHNNNSLTSLNGLNNLTSWEYNSFKGNESLENFTGLDNLTAIEDMWLDGTYFKNFEGLESLEAINWEILVKSNLYLESFQGLNNLTTLGNGGSFIGLDENTSDPLPNPLLTDYCALQNLFTNGTYGSVTIENNAFNPTVQNIIDGNCSQ